MHEEKKLYHYYYYDLEINKNYSREILSFTYDCKVRRTYDRQNMCEYNT